MKNLLIIFFCTSLVYSCKIKNKSNEENNALEAITEETKKIEMPDTSSIVRFIDRRILDKLLPYIIANFNTDNENALSDPVLREYFPNAEIYQDEDGTIRCEDELLVVTKQIDNNHIFAIAYSDIDSLLVFFRLYNERWKEIGRRKPVIPVGGIDFEELNGEPYKEIIASTWPNMNANLFKECFVYFSKEDTIKFAGSFSTRYQVDLKNKTISETYVGSHYMDPTKTLYGWYKDNLIILRRAEFIVPEDWLTSDKGILEYYETGGYNRPMKLIFRETYNERNAKHRKYWDDFFETVEKEINVQ